MSATPPNPEHISAAARILVQAQRFSDHDWIRQAYLKTAAGEVKAATLESLWHAIREHASPRQPIQGCAVAQVVSAAASDNHTYAEMETPMTIALAAMAHAVDDSQTDRFSDPAESIKAISVYNDRAETNAGHIRTVMRAGHVRLQSAPTTPSGL